MKTIWKKLSEHQYEVFVGPTDRNYPIGCINASSNKWKIEAYFTLIPELRFETNKKFVSWHEAGLQLAKLWKFGREYKLTGFYDDEYDDFDTFI